MSDQFKEVTTKSWGSRITGSIQGVLIGLLFFLASFLVLYLNEGRVDVSKMAKKSIDVDATSEISSEVDGQLVSMNGILETDEKIGDTFLKADNYIAIDRRVEMYAWKEITSSDSKRNVGGSETTETTYKYEKEWTGFPQDSTNFKKPEGHTNPKMRMDNKTVKVDEAFLGKYDIDINRVGLPGYKEIDLDSSNTVLKDGFKLAGEKYLFNGKGTMENPQIGDIKISYSVVESPIKSAVAFGKLDQKNKKVSPFYYGKKNTEIYSVFEGTRDGAIASMKAYHKTLAWILRIVGFFLMWLGLSMMLGPISVFLDVLPVFGSISRFGISIITFLVSFVLTILTIIVAMIFHNLIALIIVIVLFSVLSVVYLKNKRKKQKANV